MKRSTFVSIKRRCRLFIMQSLLLSFDVGMQILSGSFGLTQELGLSCLNLLFLPLSIPFVIIRDRKFYLTIDHLGAFVN